MIGGANNIRIFNLVSETYSHIEILDKKNILKLQSLKKSDNNFNNSFMSFLSTGEIYIYKLVKSEKNIETLQLIEEISNLFPLFSNEILLKDKFNLIFKIEKGSHNFIFLSYKNELKILHLSLKVENEEPTLAYVSNATFNDEIKYLFESERYLFFFGNNLFRMRNILELNEIILKKEKKMTSPNRRSFTSINNNSEIKFSNESHL